MKPIIPYILLPIAAWAAVSLITGSPKPASIKLTESADRAGEQRPYSATPSIPQAAEEEFNYYLERHNVLDEGYEMVVAFANGKRHEVTTAPYIATRNVGCWKNYKRHGTVIAIDDIGQTVIGMWDADTIKTGMRMDSIGTYFGDFHDLKAEGHGAYQQTSGCYFEGHWSEDRQDGFGLELLQLTGEPSRLRVGIWDKGRYQGERMKYTTERIYGIDIARYQHEKGRKRFPIQWNKLRITSIGKRGCQNVSGEANYPVSFIYIKSTEGTTIRNRYFAQDYAQANRHGIHTGAYHFFSVRSSGQEQAQHFIRNTQFKQGDLPPVLDIEPSKAQIEQMGGTEEMFRHIRTWLSIVEKWTGVKPILYVNQMFVNNYLVNETDLKRDYRIWIARYSEYKPDMKLTYWQLCADGRVTGIQTEVDINVFNGYKSQFEDFLEKESIRK